MKMKSFRTREWGCLDARSSGSGRAIPEGRAGLATHDCIAAQAQHHTCLLVGAQHRPLSSQDDFTRASWQVVDLGGDEKTAWKKVTVEHGALPPASAP